MEEQKQKLIFCWLFLPVEFGYAEHDHLTTRYSQLLRKAVFEEVEHKRTQFHQNLQQIVSADLQNALKQPFRIKLCVERLEESVENHTFIDNVLHIFVIFICDDDISSLVEPLEGNCTCLHSICLKSHAV